LNLSIKKKNIICIFFLFKFLNYTSLAQVQYDRHP
jgi:hypothetical protein